MTPGALSLVDKVALANPHLIRAEALAGHYRGNHAYSRPSLEGMSQDQFS
jgi:peptidoglycan/xylan/chitin deacetylase (PgdA/CDA1 family)